MSGGSFPVLSSHNTNVGGRYGSMIMAQLSTGVGPAVASTIPGGHRGPDTTPTGANGAYVGPYAGAAPLGSPFAVWLGMIVLLILLGYLVKSDAIPGDPGQIKVGGYNFLTIGVAASIFIGLMKVVFTRFPVPGATELFQAI